MKLNIRCTDLCNLTCDYCARRGEIAHLELGIDEFCSILAGTVSRGEYNKFTLTGGEPLLQLDRVLPIIHCLRQIAPTTPISIQTNGILLSRDIVEVLNYYDVHVLLSMQGIEGDFKSLRSMPSLTGVPMEYFISSVQAVNKLNINKVITDTSNFALDTYLLHKLFNTHVELALDSTNMVSLEHMDLIDLRLELEILKAYDLDAPNWCSLFAVREFCDCQEYVMFQDGSISHKYDIDTLTNGSCTWSGCVVQHAALGNAKQQFLIETYEKFRKG